MSKLEQGDRIGHSQTFLRSIGADKEIADMRGVITGFKKLGQNEYAYVRWYDDPDMRDKLVRVSAIARVVSVSFSD